MKDAMVTAPTVHHTMDIDMADGIMEKVMFMDVSLVVTKETEVCSRKRCDYGFAS